MCLYMFYVYIYMKKDKNWQLTVIVFIDRHSSWLKDVLFELLMDPKCDFFRVPVRNLWRDSKQN